MIANHCIGLNNVQIITISNQATVLNTVFVICSGMGKQRIDSSHCICYAGFVLKTTTEIPHPKIIPSLTQALVSRPRKTWQDGMHGYCCFVETE